jgi:hypothetical protein
MLAIAALLHHRRVERRRLVKFVQSLDAYTGRGRDAVFRVASKIFDLPAPERDPIWMSRLLGPLGASPGAIIQAGGCCSGKSRLLIVCLAELGIRSHQVTLYHKHGHAQHCLVEVRLPTERFILDPTYGIYLGDGASRGLSLIDLQRGAVPNPIPFTSSPGWGYPNDDDGYYDFDYAATKTANWTCSATRRAAYSVLRTATRGAVDRLMVPPWLEWPQNIGASVIAVLFLILATALFLSV